MPLKMTRAYRQVQNNSKAIKFIHTNAKSALISSGSLVLRLKSTTATLPSDKARDQISKPFSANYHTCKYEKTLKLVTEFSWLN